MPNVVLEEGLSICLPKLLDQTSMAAGEKGRTSLQFGSCARCHDRQATLVSAHDLWDMDNPQPPTLLTVQHEGKSVDVVAQGTKMGLLFVFDRVTGEPLWPIEERPQAASEIEGMNTWPTQPFPTQPPPLVRQRYTENDYSNISPRAEMMTKEVMKISGHYGSFPPPSLKQSIIFPGFDGGMEWGGSAADPDGILLYQCE